MILCVLALVAMAPSLASAEGHIKVSLKAAHPDEPGAKVIVTLTNTGNSPVHIMKWDTPFPPSGGRLARSLFAVTDAEGNKVRYLGSWVNFGGLKMQAFQLISPGEVLTKEIDLASEYDFKPNSIYTIGYEMDLTREPEPLVVSTAERASFIRPTQTMAMAEPIHIFFGATVSSTAGINRTLRPSASAFRHDTSPMKRVLGAHPRGEFSGARGLEGSGPQGVGHGWPAVFVTAGSRVENPRPATGSRP
jgi:hypothetical protein